MGASKQELLTAIRAVLRGERQVQASLAASALVHGVHTESAMASVWRS